MIIRNLSNESLEEIIEAKISLQKIYDWFREKINRRDFTIQDIISWLPNISKIEIRDTYCNSYIEIYFTNQEKVRIYNSGLESDLCNLIDDEYEED